GVSLCAAVKNRHERRGLSPPGSPWGPAQPLRKEKMSRYVARAPFPHRVIKRKDRLQHVQTLLACDRRRGVAGAGLDALLNEWRVTALVLRRGELLHVLADLGAVPFQECVLKDGQLHPAVLAPDLHV